MAKTRCAQDGHIDTSCGFVNWYGRARGHQEWVQAEGVAGAKEPGAEHARAASEGPGAGAVEPGDAEDPGAKGVESGAGAAEPGVRAGTPGAAVGAQLPSQGQAPTPAEGADVGSEHDSVVTLSRTLGHTLGGIGSWVTIHVGDERFGPGHAWQITDEQRSERGIRLVVETRLEGATKTIAVKPEACRALALTCLVPGQPEAFSGGGAGELAAERVAVATPQAQPGDNDQALSCLVTAGMLNQPKPLPGMQGNSITLMRMDPGPWFTALQCYPSLADQGIGLIFHSAQFNEVIVMELFDVLAWCPAKHIWPYCLYCQKFLFPAHGHRSSIKHQKALRWAVAAGPEATAAEILRRGPCLRPLLYGAAEPIADFLWSRRRSTT